MIPLLMLFYFMTFFHIIFIVIILKINGENKIALYSFQGDNKKLSYKKKQFSIGSSLSLFIRRLKIKIHI